jgi:hypothetical protein
MKIPYSFSVLRYVHDTVTQEFLNIGVAVYSPQAGYLRAICTQKYSRIQHAFEKIDGADFRELTHFIETQVGLTLAKSGPTPAAAPAAAIEALLATVLPPDDSAIQFSKAGVGLTANLDKTLNEIYQRHVEKYEGNRQPRQAENQKANTKLFHRTDNQVWQVFKKPLDTLQLTPLLRPKRIVAPNFEYEFKRSWKNARWHVCEPVSFDLGEADVIVDRANNWLGRATSLREGDNKFEIHFLLGEPQAPQLKGAFTKAQNILNKIPGKKQFVREGEARSFAHGLAKQIEAHPPTGLLD